MNKGPLKCVDSLLAIAYIVFESVTLCYAAPDHSKWL